MHYLTRSLCLILCLLIISCRPGVNISQTHLVRVEAYDDRAENLKLVADLFSYDPAYIMDQIDSYDPDSMAGAINLGYHIPTDENTNPTYRFTFKMNNKAVRKKADKLKQEFDYTISKLIDVHVSKQNLFRKLEPSAKEWILLVLESETKLGYDQASEKMKAMLSHEEFHEGIERVKSHSGKIVSTTFLRGHFYENVDGVSELANISFEQAFSEGHEYVTSIAMIFENGEWIVGGLYFTPTN